MHPRTANTMFCSYLRLNLNARLLHNPETKSGQAASPSSDTRKISDQGTKREPGKESQKVTPENTSPMMKHKHSEWKRPRHRKSSQDSGALRRTHCRCIPKKSKGTSNSVPHYRFRQQHQDPHSSSGSVLAQLHEGQLSQHHHPQILDRCLA